MKQQEVRTPVRWVIRNGERILQQAHQAYDLELGWAGVEWIDVPVEEEGPND